MENRRYRRNYFPEPKFQFRFLRFLLAGAVLQIAATVIILYYFLHQNYVLLVKYAGLDPEITKLLFRELNVLIAVISATFLIYLVGMSLLGVVFSLRIVGVVVAMKRTIRQINEGKDASLHLRTKDEFQELVEQFNDMLGRFRSRPDDPRRAAT